MSNINKVLEVSSRVITLRAQLAEAEKELATLTAGGGRTARPAQRARPAIRGAAQPSVSQRVLNMVANSGRAGIARRDIVGVIGKDHETAIHSALKAHQQRGLIENDGGMWMVTARYVEEAQAAPRESHLVDTRPMRAQHPAGGEYLQGPG